MVKIIWSNSALEDIEQISEYISKDSPDRAALFVGRIIDSTDKLTDYPYSGRIIPEVRKDEY
jgi:toxin ParE1/3/4